MADRYFNSFQAIDVNVPVEFYEAFTRYCHRMQEQKQYEEPINKVHAAIIRGGNFGEGSAVSGDSRKAALIVKVTDVEGDEVS